LSFTENSSCLLQRVAPIGSCTRSEIFALWAYVQVLASFPNVSRRTLVLFCHSVWSSNHPDVSLYLCSLPSAEPAEYGVYKPVLIIFGLVDGLQQMLKVCHQSSSTSGPLSIFVLVKFVISPPLPFSYQLDHKTM